MKTQAERAVAPARTGGRFPRAALLVVGLVALAAVPLVTGAYYTWITASVLLLALFAVGYNVLFGFTGLLSFGHAAFFGVGAYVSAGVLLTWRSLPVAVVAGTLAAAVIGVLIGYLCLRHTDIYFAMLTLAFGMMIHSIIWRWRDVTGGDDGLSGVPRGVLGTPGLGLDVGSLERFYYIILVVTVTAIYLAWRLLRSPLGLTFQGIRDNETRMAYTGIDVRRVRLASFTVSALYAGLAGSLWSPLNTNAGPGIAHWTFSAEPVLASLLGGAHVFGGPIVGAVLLFMIKQFVVQYTQYWLLVLGIIVVGLVLGFRGGVASVALRVWPRVAGAGRRRLLGRQQVGDGDG
ncbi:MAG: branched-chain amino acid ABC transporter permease [Nitriliruptorales bacterium]|nr:branched-chain amino acid ABC transporter permease [Nitriliruptorales bacterium]